MKLILYYPCYPYSLNQSFGDNKACVENRSDIPRDSRKVVGTATSGVCPLGYIPFYPDVGLKGHPGADLYALHGEPIYHAGPDGFVQEVATEPARGLGLGIITTDKYDLDADSISDFAGGSYQVKVRYWHLMSFNVKIGDKVKRGDLIGYADNTGYSAGDHLHFEIKPQNFSNGIYTNTVQNNGYMGGIDCIPYFTGKYAQDVQSTTVTPSGSRYTFQRELNIGSIGIDVIVLQNILNQMGCAYFFPTGFFGNKTKEAVMKYQIMFGILATGYVGRLTLEKLNQ